MENAQVADRLDEIADLLELKAGEPFRVRAYRNAARTVRGLSERVEDLVARGEDLSELSGVGKGTAEKIAEMLETGTCERLEGLRREVPPTLSDLLHVPGLGPRKTMEVHRELGVKTLKDLERAVEAHRVCGLPGMGQKTEEAIREGLATLRTAAGRVSIKAAREEMESLGRHLDGIGAVQRWEAAGSYRRRRETVGDLDVVVLADDRAAAIDGILEHHAIAEVASRGKERVTVRLAGGLQVDFRFIEEGSFGAALLYFTGSKEHDIALRQRAQKHRWKLNEYGLFKGDHLLAGRTEDSVYHRLGLAWIPPELRENRGEIEAAEEGTLPDLVCTGDIRGDLHAHTDASDGAESIEAMARAARERGYRYLAITDHSKAVRVAGGLDEKRLRKHAERIREVDAGLERFWLLAGVEVDILEDGRLDLDEDLLDELDWVVASVHSRFSLDERRATERLCAAIRSGVVDCIGHPLARHIGRRQPIPLDADRIFEACLEHGVRLEVNAQPERLDLPDTWCRDAREAGVGLVIDTDAHKASDLDLIEYGVGQARRGWVEKSDVLNTASLSELRRILGR